MVIARPALGLVVGVLLACVWTTDSGAQVKITHKVSATEGNLTRLLEAGDEFGQAVANIGDLDGNGVEDIVVGAAMDDYPGINHGTVWVLFMNSNGTVKARQKIGSGAGGFTGTLEQDDYFGISVAGIGDLDGDGVEDIAVGADRDDDGGAGSTADRGAVWILFLNDDGTVKAHQKISRTEGGFGGALDDGDRFGRSVSALGDLDGDSVTDIAVGAFYDDDGAADAGAVWILFLNDDGTVKSHQKISAVEGGFGGSLDSEDFFGSSIGQLGDLDRGGAAVVAIAVGARGDDDGAADVGALWILFLNNDGTVATEQKISATEGAEVGGGLVGLSMEDRFGASVTSVGRLGVSDNRIMVGAPDDGDGGPYRGAVWSLTLSATGTFYDSWKISDTESAFGGILDDNDNFGSAVTWVNDIDGDGYDDIVVGATGDDDGPGNAGAVWIVFVYDAGDDVLAVRGQQKISQTEGDFTRLLEDGVSFGESAALIGDLSNDGVPEIAVGAYTGEGGGAVWILSLSDVGSIRGSQKIGDNAGGFTAVLSSYGLFGVSVEGLGDLDGDGVEDLAVGDVMDDTGGGDRGAVYVLFLRSDGTVKSHVKIASETGGFEHTLADGAGFGFSLALLGDLDQNGKPELAVGSAHDGDGGMLRGAVWILTMNTNGTVDSEQKISDLEGSFLGVLDDVDWFGVSVASVGDLDGDGVPDLAVGAKGDDDGGMDAGAVWLLFLRPDRTVGYHAKLSASTYFAGLLDEGDWFGYSVASIGDMDGDGFNELAIGAVRDDDGATDAGAVWIACLDGTGAVKRHGKISNTDGNFGGVLDGLDAFGSAVTALGDLNSDGRFDILVGHSGEDDGGDDVGAIWPLNLRGPDDDGDGVYYAADLCPAENASFFDRDGNGCVDEYIGARHIEYWGTADVLQYYIHLEGAPNISDGSDFTAIQNAVGKWTGLAGVDVAASYGGTTDWNLAVPGDGDNLVIFVDDEYDFGTHTLAVGVTTSYDVPTFANNKFYRPGQIVDADMIFNPAKTFTTSGVSGVDLESVATHEAGHLFGISHSAAINSIMFYALQSGIEGREPTIEDVTIMQKAYPDPSWVPTTRRVYGRVANRFAQPVPGAIVFLTDAVSGDTLGCDITLPDGSFKFLVIPPWTTVYLSIHPIDGTSAIGYLEPDYVNALVDSTAVTLFPAELWNTGDSYDEDPALRTPIGLATPGEYGPFDFVTNVDTSGPAVVDHSPAESAINVRADAAVVIEFSEAIDANTLQGNFRLFNQLTGHGAAGSALVTADETLIAFTPSKLLEYSTSYICSLKTGIEDLYGNPLPAVYAFQFTTEDEPPLSLASLVPNKGAVGSIIVFNGAGFDTIPSGNVVNFTDASGLGTVTAPVLAASKTQLIVSVPAGAGSGNVNVEEGPLTSNPVSFAMLASIGVPRGYEAGVAPLGSVPRAVALAPDGDFAWVATSAGAISVNADPNSPAFLEQTLVSIPGGLHNLAITPDGAWVYAVSELDSAIHVIDCSTNSLVDELAVFAAPKGIVIAPSGSRAYVPTNEGEIQIWDVNETSATYRKPIGALTAPGSTLQGKTAIDPAGDYLLALTTTGKLLAFDLGPDTLVATVSLGSDPRDIVVDPTAQRAYVSDGSGLVSIVSMTGFYKVLDVATSGSLRGMAMAPSGEYLYGANRQLNFLDVIDLIETSPTYRNVAATIPVGVNPVDVDISPDGIYSYSLVEDSKQLVVTGIGSGPFIKSLSRRAGPPGTKLVAAGGGFGANPSLLHINFKDSNGTTFFYGGVERSTGRAIALAVPLGAAEGPATFSIKKDGPPDETSNTVSFEVTSLLEAEHLKVSYQTPLEVGPVAAAAMSPIGDQFLVGTEDGDVIFVDTKANSPTFNQRIATADVSTAPVYDIAVTPDGKRAYVSIPADHAVRIVDANRASPTYATPIGSVSFGTFGVYTPQELAISPDGELLLVQDANTYLLYYVPILPGALNENEAIDAMTIVAVNEIAFNSSGTHAYVVVGFGEAILTVCVDSSDADFWTQTSRVPFNTIVPDHPLTPLSLSMSPKGDRCVVLADDDVSPVLYLLLFDTSDPDTTVYVTATTFGDVPLPPDPALEGQRIDVSPGGDRLVYHQNGVGVVNAELSEFAFGSPRSTATPFTRLSHMDQDFTVDGRSLYAIGTYGDTLQVYSWGGALASDTLFAVSGYGQTGVTGLALNAPLRVQVRDFAGAKASVPVTFEVASGEGVFVGTNTETQVVATDANGYAEVSWQLGAAVGGQLATATAAVSEGSPLTFSATAVTDPNTLPLQLGPVKPADGATDVATTTTIVASFSRPIAEGTVTTSSVYLHKTGESTAVAGTFGFADNNRVVSITPSSALDFSTPYTLEITSAVQDQSAGSLANPATITFTTRAAPPLSLVSVSPPSGTAGITAVLAGVSFNLTASQNEVYFGTKKAVPYAAAFDYVKVKVPADAETGSIRLYNGADTSNALPFTVLVQSNVATDEVVAKAGTGTATRSVTINPDGSVAYAVSPDGDVVVPIDVDTKTSLPGITVGDHPISIAVHPEGTYVYVPNFNSNTLSVIGIDETVPAEYHKVVTSPTVGNFPMDVVVHPDGDWVYVVNAGSDYAKNIDIIDGDDQSVNHNTVVAKAGTGTASRSVTINPDGTLLYVGTDDGYVVLNSGDQSFSVVGKGQTGTAARSVTINPDGTLLFFLGTDGNVVFFDITPNSSNENHIVAAVQGSSSTKEIALSSDGAILYLIQEENDVIDVVGIEIQGAIGVIERNGVLPPFQVVTTPLGSIFAGEDPEAMVFDPAGSGLALVTNSGPQTVTFLEPSFVALELPPDPICVPAYSTLPSISLAGFEMKNSTSESRSYEYTISTWGPCELSPGALATTSGAAPGGSGALEVFRSISPAAALAGAYTEVVGTTPVIAPGDSFAPPPAVLNIPAIHEHLEQRITYSVSPTTVPNLAKTAKVIVIIDAPVPVFVTGFFAEALDEGVRLTWNVVSDEDISGYRIYRFEAGAKNVEIANTDDLIPIGEREWTDKGIRSGREYEYTLGVALADGGEALSQPVKVRTRALVLSLSQNHPNPFNPTTTIEFTIPDRQHVVLAVYNVAGQRVATLVDQTMPEGRKQITWDGQNSQGAAVSTGVYFCRLQTGGKTLTRKMVVLK